jgi:hypothetical protein
MVGPGPEFLTAARLYGFLGAYPEVVPVFRTIGLNIGFVTGCEQCACEEQRSTCFGTPIDLTCFGTPIDSLVNSGVVNATYSKRYAGKDRGCPELLYAGKDRGCPELLYAAPMISMQSEWQLSRGFQT